MSTRRRPAARTASLTPLLDVLFILLFASLIQARGVTANRLEPVAVADESDDSGVPPESEANVRDAGINAATPEDASPVNVMLASNPNETLHLRRSRAIAESLSSATRGVDVYEIEINQSGLVFAASRMVPGDEPVRRSVEHRLLRSIPATESDMEYEYVGFQGSGVCGLIRDRFGLSPDISQRAVVMIILTVPLADLPRALSSGLKRDLVHCLDEAGGMGMLVQPGDEDDHGIQ